MSDYVSSKSTEAGVFPKSVGLNALNEYQSPQPWNWSYNEERTIVYLEQKDGYIFDNPIERRPIGEADVGDIAAGVLTITPDMGRHITLTGHGAADFTITGFGTLCPRGYEFSLYIPRTITTGVANSLGHYVDFDHAVAGEGLDLTITRYQNGITSVYGYTAYPDACEAAGYPAALNETLTFLHEGDGRWRLTRLPDPATGTNANGKWEKKSDGTMICWYYTSESLAIDVVSSLGGYNKPTSALTFPAEYLASPVVSPINQAAAVSVGLNATPSTTTVTLLLRAISSVSAATRYFGYIAIGRWK